ELDRIPVQPREKLQRVQTFGLEAAFTERLHVAGKYRVEQQGYMAEQVMEKVGFDDVVELCFRTQPRCDRKTAVGQQGEELAFGNQAGHGDKMPAGGWLEQCIDILEARYARACRQMRERGDEFIAGTTVDMFELTCEQPSIAVVFVGGIGTPVLLAGVVRAGFRVVAA